MRLNSIFKANRLFLMGILANCIIIGCTETEIEQKPIDETSYTITDGQKGYLRNMNGQRYMETIELKANTSGFMEFTLNATSKAEEISEILLKYDLGILEDYNNETGNEFEALPENSVKIENNGSLILNQNQQQTSPLRLEYTLSGTQVAGKTYVIPLYAKTKSGNLKLSETDSRFLLFLKVAENPGDCNKGNDAVKIFSCIEVNDTNPLNHLCFKLKNSQKYLIDAVILFSDNVILDKETGTVHAGVNDNVMHVLNNREKYLKPLQDRGIKVILSIMAHHTHAGVANMKEETAKAFAKELKIICDTYQLDGIFYDDEYSTPEVPTPSGFDANRSYKAGARLFYEVKRIMPDRWNIAYHLNGTSDFSSEDCKFLDHNGEKKGPEYYVDYAVADYNDYDDIIELEKHYPGLPENCRGINSQEFNRGYWCTEDDLQEIKQRKAISFIFGMSPFRDSFRTPPFGKNDSQLSMLEKMVRIFYDDELVYDEKPLDKDW